MSSKVNLYEPPSWIGDGIGKVGREKVVIGETMDRVISKAKEIGASWYKPRSKNPFNWMANNRKWIQRQMDEGKEIIDYGIDKLRTERSEYYKMEKNEIQKRDYPTTNLND